MRCDDARAASSVRLDGEASSDDHGEAVDRHVEACAACRAWLDQVAGVRRALRFEVMESVPDITPSVMARLPARRTSRSTGGRRILVPTLAAMVAGMVAGAVLVSGTRPGSRPAVVQADIPRQVAAAQVDLQSLQATVEVREHGWHRAVPVRTYRGHLTYRAPESVTVQLTDTTEYPGRGWPSNDVALALHDQTYWHRGLFACPADAQPACTPEAPRVRVVAGREPFAAEGVDLLDLVLPASGFEVGETASTVEGQRDVRGRQAVGVLTTAAQLDGFLSALRQAGNWRDVHPTDAVELWLDATSLVPLAVDLIAAPGIDRERWAAARGYADRAGMQLLSIRFGGHVLNEPVPDTAFPAAPSGARTIDAGFRDGPVPLAAAPEPRWLPPGMAAARTGVVGGGTGPEVAVRTWTDGRAWLKVRSTTAWPGGRLFGDLGTAPRRIDLASGGVAYIGEEGDRVGVHSRSADVVVSGSLPLPVLERVAASLGVQGEAVPAGWAEAGEAVIPADTLVPARLAGFAPPAVHASANAVTLAYAGPGARGFRLTQEPGSRLGPPVGDDVRGVRVRGTTGRYSPSLGLLEWVEEGRTVVGLGSRTLHLAELIEIAESLRPSP